MLKEYLKVKTGQDLIDLGVVPKTSSAHLTLIAYKRLVALRDHTLAGINEDVLGKWMPLLHPVMKNVEPEITNPADICRYAQGRKVKLRNPQQIEMRDLEGIVRNIQGDRLTVQWKENKQGTVNAQDLVLLVPEGKVTDGFELGAGVVADKQLGHVVRFKEGSEFNFPNNSKIAVPPETIGTLVEYHPRNETVTVRIDEGIAEAGQKKNFALNLPQAYSNLEVSSLGAIAPLNKELEVRKKTFTDFFPRTVIDTKPAEFILIGLLMGKNMIMHGPPGGGKSNTAKDVVELARQQEVIFCVEGCQVQCNPYSLFDATFAEVVPPCPECMIRYDKDFKDTGRFNMPHPHDVRVVVASYSQGHGIAFVEGTTALNRMHLTGFKIPRFDGSTTNEYDPEGFSPGVLIRSNNGIIHMDEMDKLRPPTLDGILEALNSKRMKPDQLRYFYPADSVIIGTANDVSGFSEALNDRMLLLEIRYPEDPDMSHGVTRRGYHEEFSPLTDVPIGDTHKDKNRLLRSMPMPIIIERAVDAFYIKIRDEYAGPGKREIFGSNRSKFDALDAARARLILDQIFFEDTPVIVTAKFAMKGIQYAVCSRVQERMKDETKKAKNAFNAWVEKEFSEVVRREEDTWWCRLYKHVAIAKVQLPSVETDFTSELQVYEADPRAAVESFSKVKFAYDNQTNERAQVARIKYPFIDYLFKEQPRFSNVNETQLVGLMTYFLQSRKSTNCKMSGAGAA